VIARVSVLLKIRKMSRELRKWNLELEHRVDERTRELRETQDQLIQAEKLATIGTLAGGVAHEINNPLTAVLTNAQLLKMDASKEDVEELSLIEEGAKRCKNIVQQLMRYARKDFSSQSFQTIDLNSLVKNTVMMFQYQFHQESVHFDLRLDSKGAIDGIPNELEQLLTNILLNGKDAIRSNQTSGVITIRTVDQQESIEWMIEDNGPGMSEETLRKIFDPFFTTKDVGKGTGLGLTICQNIVERHRGELSVQSRLGGGSEFLIRLPTRQEKNTDH